MRRLVTRATFAAVLLATACSSGPTDPEGPSLRQHSEDPSADDHSDKGPDQQLLWGYPMTIERADESARNLLFERDGFRLEVSMLSGIPPEQATTLVEERMKVFMSVFNKVRTGYPGQLTRELQCPDEFRPVYGERTVSGGLLRYHTVFANKNRVAGACSRDLAALRTLRGHIVCDGGVLADVAVHVGLDAQASLDELVSQVDCQF